MTKLMCFAFLLALALEVYGLEVAVVKNTIPRFFTESGEDVEPFVFECSKDGIFVNTRNCSTFIQCSNGEAHLMPCPTNLHFSAKTQTCEKQCDAHCDRTLACECGWPTCSKELCFLTRDLGPCRGHKNRYFYDKNVGVCKRFIYFGCEGNENNFKTIQDCEKVCGDAIDVCKLPSMKGPCRKRTTKYFFNSKKGRCQKFTYGGCLGNGNNFETKQKCEQKCLQKTGENVSEEQTISRESTQVSEESTEILEDTYELLEKRIPIECLSDPKRGHCKDKIPRWNYSSRKDKCYKFIYSGCGGNGNNFISKEECEGVCLNERKTVSEDEIKDRHYCFKEGIQPYFRSCTKYVWCLNQIGYIIKCPPGLHFNAKMKKCVIPCAAFCDPEYACQCSWKKCVTEKLKCLEQNGNFSIPSDCSKFIQCKDSELTVEDCPKETAFDVQKKICVSSKEVICYHTKDTNLNSDMFKCPQKNGNFSVPIDCTQYIECKNSKPTTKECPEGKSFDSMKKICVPWYEAICYRSSDTDLNFPFKIICPQKNGNFSVPLDCTKYVDCKDFISTPKACPSGNYFDSIKKICVPWYEAFCYPGKWAESDLNHIKCSPEGDFIYPPNCKKFIRCRDTYLDLLDCPEDTSFDNNKKQCLPDEEAICIR